MKTLSPWQAHTGSVVGWLRGLLQSGAIDANDTVYGGPDGSYGVGQPTLDQMDDDDIMEMSEAGTVAEWLEDNE